MKKKSGVPPGGCRGKPSKSKIAGRGGCHLRKLKVTILKHVLIVWPKNLLCILEMSFPSYKPKKNGEIPISRTFLAKFPNLAYISLKIGYFELGHAYLGYWYLFWYVWKEKTLSYIMVPTTCIGVSFSSSQGGCNHPLGKLCYKKCFGGRGLYNSSEKAEFHII